MDLHAIEYYSVYSEESPHGHFHRVIPLHEDPLLDWSEASKIAPRLNRGWYELAQLSIPDRIEFTREFWISKLPYHHKFSEFLIQFFDMVDEIGIFLTQQKYEDPFEPHLIYSLVDNSGFFHGGSPATDSDIIRLQKDFPNYILPADYTAFLQIHDGFAKQTDTGIIPSKKMKEGYEIFQDMLEKAIEPVSKGDGDPVNPASLIPFYESFGMPFFQCFWGEWYPAQEMGNVYFSALKMNISACKQKNDYVETMAFETFLDWLMFYLEKID